MSHYTTVDLEVRDVEAFIEALCGTWPTPLDPSQVEVNADPVHLYGYQGDRREQQANVIVRRKNISPDANDIGFAINDGKATAFVSENERDGQYTSAWQGRLMQRYARNVAVKTARARGYRVRESMTEDGSIKLELTR